MFFSCTEGVVYESLQSVNNSWAKDSVYTFEINRPLSKNPQNIFLILRNNEDYAYSNIYFFMTLETPKGIKTIDTLQYRLAKPDGSWVGKGMSSVKENLLLYRENERFLDSGVYKIHIKQGMRADNLKGLEDIGLIIQNTQTHE